MRRRYMTNEQYTYKEAQEHLGIKDTALRDRIRLLGITPDKRGRLAYLSADDLAKLADEFLIAKAREEQQTRPVINQVVINSDDFAKLINRLDGLENKLRLPAGENDFLPLLESTIDPIDNQKKLREAAVNLYVLSTSELLGYGVSRVDLFRNGMSRGYLFKRSGKVGRELGWRIEALSLPALGADNPGLIEFVLGE